ncbi:hypothetical protein P4O66_003478 [Electrophorus voltai]|uniref:Reverse transcriptase domain-containing protein n=1 Tax=Electrophorus voltai TaxID=2609070 RepID=A0AAD8YR93_9TELE|nr:hypothetical protein P4O66_003478 [Electrophorus voltai]
MSLDNLNCLKTWQKSKSTVSKAMDRPFSGMILTILKKRATITKMVVFPSEAGRSMTKSIEMGTNSPTEEWGSSLPAGGVHKFLLRVQSVHEDTYLMMSLCMAGHQYLALNRCVVCVHPGSPVPTDECAQVLNHYPVSDLYLEYFEPQVRLGLKYLVSRLMDDKHRDYFLSWLQDGMNSRFLSGQQNPRGPRPPYNSRQIRLTLGSLYGRLQQSGSRLWNSFLPSDMGFSPSLHTTSRISYSRDALISLNLHSTHLKPSVSPDPRWPTEILRENKRCGARKRPRGKRAGIRNRLRAQAHRAPLPSILLANVQSLDNKLDDLRARIKFQRDIRDCNLLCFTESWLNPAVPNHAIQPAEFFSVHRMDRTADSGKSRGGRVCVMVNNSWCNNANVVILTRSCSPNLELLALKLRPFYLPREFTSVIINTVYIPPQANMDTALCELHEALTQFQTQHWDAALIVVGDFNSANLKRAVPNLYQHVTFPTRGNRTLDHCYTPYKDRSPNSANANGASANSASPNGTIGAASGTYAGPTIEQRPLIITESDVRRVFKRVNTRKAMGPDGICGRVLKACADQLAPVFTDIFNLSLTLSIIPSSFKRSTIVPIPKKPRPSDLNDYRPVALTSVVMKCFEKLVRDFITSSLPASMDPLQFAYRHNRSTDDAIAHLLHTTLTHLDEGRGNYVKIMPSLLTTKLGDLGLHTSLCDWISNFLTDRPQSVRLGNCASSTLTLSTGAPQGCVLSPLLYSLYTYDCTTTSSSNIIVKFADDTVVMGLISDNDERAYLEEIKHLENWCQENNLLLNVSKTKELIVDCSKKQERHYQPVRISGTTVERVDSFRRLRDFRLPSKVLRNFYTCTIESILTGNITVWFGNSTKQDRQALQRVVRSAERITHTELPDLQTIYYKRCQTKARKIVKDPTHPNNRLFSLLRKYDGKDKSHATLAMVSN